MIGNPRAARVAIFNALATNSTLCDLIGGTTNPRIFQQVGEQGASFPMVIVRSLPFARDTKNANADVIFSNLIFNVYGVAQEIVYADLEPIQHQIETTLTGLRINVGDNRLLSLTRLNPIDNSNTVEGVTYIQVGVQYAASVK